MKGLLLEVKDYNHWAKVALNITGITYSCNDDISVLTKRLKSVMPIYSTSTEKQIILLCNQIAHEIEVSGNIHIIEKLVEELSFEVDFLLFD